MAVMLRRGAPLAPHLTAALGGLAAAALASFALRFISQEPSVFVLVWHIGTVVLFSMVAGWVGRNLLNWRSVLTAARRAEAIKRGGHLPLST
jgi:hypothetical protein